MKYKSQCENDKRLYIKPLNTCDILHSLSIISLIQVPYNVYSRHVFTEWRLKHTYCVYFLCLLISEISYEL